MIHSLAAWGALRDFAASVIVWTRPHSAIPAGTVDNTIFIDPELSEAETKCVLMHEIIHLELGHVGCQPTSVEREVQLMVARRLVQFDDLRRVAGWSNCPREMADELGVTEQVVLDRMATLDGDEIQTLWPPSDHIA
ncbi:ImmA/IrrE family metallo-endopeptidase [Glutamicibacter sp. FR1]|uniref:ImmA/IrrE family metallo-endopeptidase n=1 Tax=Glutamicibacter sp. FR1 TaxID=3393744 RepID=UPI0039B0317F